MNVLYDYFRQAMFERIGWALFHSLCRATAWAVAGRAGVGGLVATGASSSRRNQYVGEELAKGKSSDEIRGSMVNVAEGVDTTAAAMGLSRKLGVEMPITQALYGVLFEGVPLDEAISQLLERAPGSEFL